MNLRQKTHLAIIAICLGWVWLYTPWCSITNFIFYFYAFSNFWEYWSGRNALHFESVFTNVSHVIPGSGFRSNSTTVSFKVVFFSINFYAITTCLSDFPFLQIPLLTAGRAFPFYFAPFVIGLLTTTFDVRVGYGPRRNAWYSKTFAITWLLGRHILPTGIELLSDPPDSDHGYDLDEVILGVDGANGFEPLGQPLRSGWARTPPPSPSLTPASSVGSGHGPHSLSDSLPSLSELEGGIYPDEVPEWLPDDLSLGPQAQNNINVQFLRDLGLALSNLPPTFMSEEA